MTRTRRWLIGVTVVAGVVSLGCNPLTAPYFFMFGSAEKVPAEFALATAPRGHDHNKPVRVVFLTSLSTEVPVEFADAERSLTQMLVQAVTASCAMNKEWVEVVPVAKIEQWKSAHPGWRALAMNKVAKAFEADYVVSLEIATLTMYEQGSHNQLYRGRANIGVSVFDGMHGLEAPVYKKTYTCVYPEARGAVHVDMDTPAEKFRDEFQAYVVTDLMWLFSTHLKEEEYHRPN